jgi:hypothetical protein
LLVVATMVALWHRAKSVHWIMDLYPEIAVALGEVREGMVSRVIAGMTGWCYRRAAKVVALDDDMAGCLRKYGVECAVIRPWVFASVLRQLAEARAEPAAEWTWIYSGNLGRAHEWETLLQAQAALDQRGVPARLLFQGGGPSREAAQARARELGLQRCEWTGYVEEAELPNSLLRAHVLAVTQLPAAQGLLWPSKLGLILSLPRPILWVGPVDGAIGQMLRPFSRAGVFAPGQGKEVADWLANRVAQGGAVATAEVLDPAAHRTASLAAWMELFRRLA